MYDGVDEPLVARQPGQNGVVGRQLRGRRQRQVADHVRVVQRRVLLLVVDVGTEGVRVVVAVRVRRAGVWGAVHCRAVAVGGRHLQL